MFLDVVNIYYNVVNIRRSYVVWSIAQYERLLVERIFVTLNRTCRTSYFERFIFICDRGFVTRAPNQVHFTKSNKTFGHGNSKLENSFRQTSLKKVIDKLTMLPSNNACIPFLFLKLEYVKCNQFLCLFQIFCLNEFMYLYR